MKRHLILIGGMAAVLAVVSCDSSGPGGGARMSPGELDRTVEEVWVRDMGGTVVPLDKWLSLNRANTLEWISRVDALGLHGEAKAKFGVELSAISEPELPNHTVAVVAKIPDGVNRDALAKLLERAPSEFQLEVQLGNKWLAMDGVLSDDGEYVPK